MTLKKFDAMCEAIKEEQIGLFRTAEKMYADGIYDVEQYVEIGIKNPVGHWHQPESFFKKVEVCSDDLYGEFDADIKLIEKFKKIYEETQGVAKTKPYMQGNAYDSDIDYIWYTFSHYVLDETKLDEVIKRKIRNTVAERLTPEGQEPRTPDCAMLQLFKDGKIDWDTLRQITYKDCEL